MELVPSVLITWMCREASKLISIASGTVSPDGQHRGHPVLLGSLADQIHLLLIAR